MFVLINLFGQLGGAVLVIARKYVEVACGILFGIIAIQVGNLFFNFIVIPYKLKALHFDRKSNKILDYLSN